MPTGDGDRNALVASALIMPISSALPPDEVASPPRAEEVAPTVAAAEAVSGADVLALDPDTMVDPEIAGVLGGPIGCTFRYASAGKPVLALERWNDLGRQSSEPL